MPRSRCSADVPPERCCAIMADELAALAQDIEAARRRARRTATPALGLGRKSLSTDGEPVRLDGGARITIRPVRPDDAGRTQRRLRAPRRPGRLPPLPHDRRPPDAPSTRIPDAGRPRRARSARRPRRRYGRHRRRRPLRPRSSRVAPRAGGRGRHRLLATTRRRDRAASAAPRAGTGQRRGHVHRRHGGDQRRSTAADAACDVDRGRRELSGSWNSRLRSWDPAPPSADRRAPGPADQARPVLAYAER